MEKNKGFEAFLRGESDLDGLDDLAKRMPRILYNYWTDGGNVSMRGKLLRFYPRNWDGYSENMDPYSGLVYMGNHLTFMGDEGRLITMSDPMNDAVYKNPSREFLRSSIGDAEGYALESKTLARQVSAFSAVELLGTQTLTIALTPKGDRVEGSVKPYADSFIHYVGKPLSKTLWRT